MGISSWLFGDKYGTVTGGEYNGAVIKLGTDSKFSISKGTNAFDFLLFVTPFSKDVKVYFRDITSYKVISSTFNTSNILIEVGSQRHTLQIIGQNCISNIIGLIEQKGSLN